MSSRSTYHIHDMTITTDFNIHGCIEVVVRSIGKTFILADDYHAFKNLCRYMNSVYSPQEVYNSVIGKLVSSKLIPEEEVAMTMYDEYFGMDRLAEREIRERTREFCKKDNAEKSKKSEQSRIARSKLGMTFWGALLVQDIMIP